MTILPCSPPGSVMSQADFFVSNRPTPVHSTENSAPSSPEPEEKEPIFKMERPVPRDYARKYVVGKCGFLERCEESVSPLLLSQEPLSKESLIKDMGPSSPPLSPLVGVFDESFLLDQDGLLAPQNSEKTFVSVESFGSSSESASSCASP